MNSFAYVATSDDYELENYRLDIRKEIGVVLDKIEVVRDEMDEFGGDPREFSKDVDAVTDYEGLQDLLKNLAKEAANLVVTLVSTHGELYSFEADEELDALKHQFDFDELVLMAIEGMY